MGNIHPAGAKKDDRGGGGGGDQQLEAVSVLELQAGVAEDQLQPLGGWPSIEATSMLENDRTNSTATDEIGTDNMIDMSPPAAEPDIPNLDDPLHPWPPPQSLPKGVLSVLNTSPVRRNCIGDGDGFTAYEQRIAGDTNIGDPQQYRIRMKGIDAPELPMKYGVESKNELVRLIGGKHVSILVYGLDQYGRSLGDIYCDGVFIQEQMLKGGFAWHYKKCDKRPEFAKWQREAKVARRGLWSLHKPQKPWVWRRDNPRINNKKENADDNKVEPQSQINGSSETLPSLIMKDMEDLGKKWKENLEIFVSENMKLHNQVQELKRDKKEAEDRAKKTEKKMARVLAGNMKLNGQLQESERNKKDAENRVLRLEFFSGSVAAVNMDLHHKIEVLENENKKADDRAKEKESEMESVGAENRKLKDQLQVAEGRAVNLTYFSGKVVGVNKVLNDSLEELKKKNKQAEERAEETDKEMEGILNDNIKLNDQIQNLKRINKEVASSARNSKLKLQSVLAVNMDLDKKEEDLGTSSKKGQENVGAENMKGKPQDIDQIQKLKRTNKEVASSARNSKKKLQSVLAINMDLDKKEEDLGTSWKKGLVIVGAENMKGKPQGISHKKSEQTVEIPSTPPAKDFSVKEWRKKTTPTTSSAPPPKGHYA